MTEILCQMTLSLQTLKHFVMRLESRTSKFVDATSPHSSLRLIQPQLPLTQFYLHPDVVGTAPRRAGERYSITGRNGGSLHGSRGRRLLI